MVLVRTASSKIEIYICKFSILGVKFSIYFKRCVFIMSVCLFYHLLLELFYVGIHVKKKKHILLCLGRDEAFSGYLQITLLYVGCGYIP